MLASVRGFLKRHHRKFIVGGLLIGSFVFVTRYSQRRIREWQEKEVREWLLRSRRRQQFESAERSCNQMIINVSVCLRNSITKSLDIESVVEKLRKNSCVDKVATWNELKSLAITRSAVVVYSTTMLVVMLRIQVSLMNGLMFKNVQNPDSAAIDEEEREKYLSMVSYLVQEGVAKLADFLRQKVDEITCAISLTDNLTLRDIEQIYWSIVSSVAADATRDPVRNIVSYVIGDASKGTADLVGTRITQETVDILESDEVQNLTQSTIRSGFALLVDHISEYFIDSSNNSNNGKAHIEASVKKIGPANGLTNGYMNLNEITRPLAKIIPIINGQVSDTPQAGDLASDWLQSNIVNDKINTLSANIYEAFSF